MLNVLATNIQFTTACGLTSDAIVLANIVSKLITAIKILIPIALIIFGMLDLGKAVMSNDEKTMKEAQGRLIKRIMYAVLIFLIVTIVQVVFGFIGSNDSGIDTTNATNCISCFVNGVDGSGICK